MRIFISTSDGHDLSLKPFAYLFNMYWGKHQEVTVLGYRQPPFKLPDNFNFIQLAEKQHNVFQWSTDLRRFFESIEDEHFIWAVEDAYILQPVDFVVLRKLESYLDDSLVGRIGLTNDVVTNGEFFIVENCNNQYYVVSLTQKSKCRISGVWSIWNRQYFLKYMKDNLTPWQYEVDTSNEAKDDGYKILSSNLRFPVHCALGIRKKTGLECEIDFRFINDKKRSLDERIINRMIEKKIISKERTLI
jgi:hypothetical protein